MPASSRKEVSLKEWTSIPVSNAAESGKDENALTKQSVNQAAKFQVVAK